MGFIQFSIFLMEHCFFEKFQDVSLSILCCSFVSDIYCYCKFIFDDFLTLAPEIDKTIPRRFDLVTFWPWLRKETKPTTEGSI